MSHAKMETVAEGLSLLVFAPTEGFQLACNLELPSTLVRLVALAVRLARPSSTFGQY